MSPLGTRDLYFEVKAFQAAEIALLQGRRFDEWATFFAEDLRYWMPLVYVADRLEDGESGLEDLAYFDESLTTLKLRIARMKSAMAWTEIPPSRVRYFVEPYAVAELGGDEVSVASNILVYQTRLQREENLFVGYREDRLRRSGGNFRIAARKIVADRAVLPGKNLTIFL